jgi:type I restriction enzyme R subunit
VVNERFGTDFNQADQLFFDQIVQATMADEGLRQVAAVNPTTNLRWSSSICLKHFS